MFNFFKKEEFKIVAPVDGEMVLLENVPDEMFSQKIMGDGFAVKPENGEVVAPISGVTCPAKREKTLKYALQTVKNRPSGLLFSQNTLNLSQNKSKVFNAS